MRPRLLSILWLGLALGLLACDQDGSSPTGDEVPVDADTGKQLLGAVGEGELVAAKDDSTGGVQGPTTVTPASAAVWTVERRWYHVENEAGLAWPANANMTWDDKYAAWVASLEKTDSESYYKTFELTTPWGKTLPAPTLECAETAMFLRATFASWYGLPFFMSAYHPTHKRVYFGHFGIVKGDGSVPSSYPWFKSRYDDHTAAFAGKSDAEIVASWPSDSQLRERYLTTLKDDGNPFLGEDLYAGAYFDEIFLNKRVGWFMLRLLTNMGSMHLADSRRNMFNIKPEAVRAGDVVLQRWQRSGIGHTLVVKQVEHLEGGRLSVDTVFGSMPRIQPQWYGTDLSKSYLTSYKTGGVGENAEGDRYAALGGGLKRWRTPVTKNGRWYNIVPVKDREEWISSTAYTSLAERTQTFEELLGALTPEEEKATLLLQIETARNALKQRPASCANRQRRQEAWDKLVALNESAFGISATETAREHAILDDYVFAPLEYESSITCCWNSSTNAMYELVMELNRARVYDEATQTCNAPLVFKAVDGDFAEFRAYAESVGKGAEWVAWSADESCPQAAAGDVTDTEAELPESHVALCDIVTDVLDIETAAPTPEPEPEPEPVEPASGCGDVTWEGHCEGNTVVWCQDDTIQRHECGASAACANIEEYGYYWCE